MDILLAPAVVQGDKSAASLREALVRLIAYHQKAPEEKKLDVIVLTRGGGSLEDLWSFNDEALAWEIYNCPIPVMSAVGHEVDFSISDYVADKRCETPTAAAEVLTQAQVSLKQRLRSLKRSLNDFGTNIMHRRQLRLEAASPFSMLRKIENRLYHYHKRLDQCRLSGRLPEFTGIHEYTLRLEDCLRTLKGYPERFKELNTRIEHKHNLLKLMNPENILGKGYTYIKDESGALVGKVSDFDKLADESVLQVHFSDGNKKVIKRSSPS